MGHTTPAILFGMAISLGINGYRLANRKVKTLDAVSLVFLAIACAGRKEHPFDMRAQFLHFMVK